MPLPLSCAQCIFLEPTRTTGAREVNLCRRHAPSPGDEEFIMSRWPLVKLTNRCGAGATPEDPDADERPDDDAPTKTACTDCIHWLQPEGGVMPDVKRGLPASWWADAGYCTRFAPSPSGEEDQKTFW